MLCSFKGILGGIGGMRALIGDIGDFYQSATNSPQSEPKRRDRGQIESVDSILLVWVVIVGLSSGFPG